MTKHFFRYFLGGFGGQTRQVLRYVWSSEKEHKKCIFRLAYFHRIQPMYRSGLHQNKLLDIWLYWRKLIQQRHWNWRCKLAECHCHNKILLRNPHSQYYRSNSDWFMSLLLNIKKQCFPVNHSPLHKTLLQLLFWSPATAVPIQPPHRADTRKSRLNINCFYC